MRAIVTGGAGFIGSHLVDRLLEYNHKVIVVDDLSEGNLENLPIKNPHLEFHKVSILDNIDLLFKKVDVVFHLAALTRPQQSIEEPKKFNRVNIEGTLNVLIHSKDYNVKRVVFMSSSSLYGTQKFFPTTEDDNPSPLSPYALHKLMGEQYCKLFEVVYGLQFNAIRPFNVFGERQNPRGGYAAAIPKFIDMIEKGEQPYITGDGEQTRDFIHVDDVIDLLVLAAHSEVHGKSFNAGSETNISINDLYDKVCELMEKDIKAKHIDAVLEPRVTLSDMTRAKELLGWKSKVSLEEGLKRLL